MLDGLRLDYKALVEAAVAQDPFPHVLIRDFVPAASLERIRAALPHISAGGSFPATSLKLGPPAEMLVRELEAEKLKEIVASKFEIDVRSAPTMSTVRGMTREKDGRIHRDSSSKRVTMLVYLNPPAPAWETQGGCLRLLRGPHDVEDYAVEVPPVNGTLLIFPNGPSTWHGHRPFMGQRYAIQVNYMESDNAVRRELRRHKLSAVMACFSASKST